MNMIGHNDILTFDYLNKWSGGETRFAGLLFVLFVDGNNKTGRGKGNKKNGWFVNSLDLTLLLFCLWAKKTLDFNVH